MINILMRPEVSQLLWNIIMMMGLFLLGVAVIALYLQSSLKQKYEKDLADSKRLQSNSEQRSV